jgi:1-acyl-sn-glycerol-3-phosphate acyltransferase
MWQPPTMELMPGFWPPRPSRLWNVLLQPLRRHYLHRHYRISNVTLAGQEHLNVIQGGDGVLLAPNHSHDADPHVMMHVGRLLSRQFYFMAAWQVFLAHKGIDGWVMQRFGAFSVDREGCDRRAIRQATEILTSGRWLVVFPEGEIYHTNERLTPLREGVAFMAITSQRDLDKQTAKLDDKQRPHSVASPDFDELSRVATRDAQPLRVWIVPTRIRYRYDQDIATALESSVASLEQRLMLRPIAGAPLPQRMVRIGEILLTIKEKEQLGRSMEEHGDLPTRLKRLIDHILARHENAHLAKVNDAESVPVRVKTLRRHLIEQLAEEKCDDARRRAVKDALDELHLVMQLYSYPGDYVSSNPTPERMAETVEKFEEDLLGASTPKGPRSAAVIFGRPIDVRPFCAARSRTASMELTAKLEAEIRELMTR